MRPGTAYTLEVNPRIPPRLARMGDLVDNLWYSWDRPTRELFARLHPKLWAAVGHSPKTFLKRVDERKLLEAAEDPAFLTNYNSVLAAFDTYHSEPVRLNGSESLDGGDLVAYFCAEFGFHESLPIYSGGLGILAGDHCKAASDIGLPFVGVGLLYRQGYFEQTIDAEGRQNAAYFDSDFDDLPVQPVNREAGDALLIEVSLPGRKVILKVWRAKVGHVSLYLLDSDVAANSAHDRSITHQLYGGDRTTRIEQEIVLGVGGVRALAALNLNPTIWHINEGHAAFSILERIRALASRELDFAASLELVAASTVFTTHTAVPAGHDQFAEDLIGRYFEDYCGEVGIDHGALMELGRAPAGPDFNMTTLALRGSRFHNGVSRIHREVASQMLRDHWPQIEAGENPIEHVTNGVHAPTFLSTDWADSFERFLGVGWTQRLNDSSWWDRIGQMPDQIFWSIHQHLKSRMLHLVRYRIREQHARNHGSEAHLDRMLRYANPDDPNVLTVGFGRRFATYKRASLLFENLDWLRQIASGAGRPVLFVFAGKAHPADKPGQDMIQHVTQVSRMLEFEGRILFVENYDLRLARRLVSGVDVWLNNPVYPFEASGTSGMKAGMNGVINLSVLDGWWGEGYERGNGWAIKPVKEAQDDKRRDREEARTLYEILQDQVIPLYYNRCDMGYSPEWIRMAKQSMATILPRFNAGRMVGEYLARFYLRAARQGARYAEEQYRPAREVAAWKARIRAAWAGVSLRRIDAPRPRIRFGETVQIEVGANLNGLEVRDVVVEIVFDQPETGGELGARLRRRLVAEGARKVVGEHRFALELEPELCGKFNYRIRCFPHHELLTHEFELGLMVWV